MRNRGQDDRARRRHVAGLAALALAAIPQLALARSMTLIQGDKVSGILVDKDALQKPNGGVGRLAVWQTFAATDDGADYTLSQYEVDCAIGKARVLDSAEFTVGGQRIRAGGQTDWVAVPANSVGDLIKRTACGSAPEPVRTFGDVGPDEAVRLYRSWALGGR